MTSPVFLFTHRVFTWLTAIPGFASLNLSGIFRWLRRLMRGHAAKHLKRSPLLILNSHCKYAAWLVLLLALSSPVRAAEHVIDAGQAVEMALVGNPGLAELNARFLALAEVPSQAGSLPDPMFNFNAMNFPTDTFDTGQEAMTQLQLGFSQMIPFPGKLRLKREAAEYDALGAEQSVEEAQLQLIRDVKTSWWQLFFLDHALATVSKNQSLLRQLITVARTKYETGQGLQQDVLLAQLELSKLLDQDIQLEAIRRHQQIRINTLMDRPADDAVMLSDATSISVAELNDASELFTLAESLRPALARSETQIGAAEARLKLAKRNRYPDFMVGMTYGDRSGSNPLPRGGERVDFASLMIGVKVPLYAGRKQSRAVSQRTHELEESRYAFRDEKAAVNAAIATAISDYDRAKQQFSLYRNGILTQARQTVQSMQAGYQVSEVDFLNLVRSQITLFNYELQYWKAFSEAKQALARLEAAVGGDTIYE